jgi:hypothetical protein
VAHLSLHGHRVDAAQREVAAERVAEIVKGEPRLSDGVELGVERNLRPAPALGMSRRWHEERLTSSALSDVPSSQLPQQQPPFFS